ALEVAGSGVTVNAICPGWVGSTGLFDETIANIVKTTGRDASVAVKALADMSPLKRVMQPEEIAHVALMLAADEAAGINGQGNKVCGGWVMDGGGHSFLGCPWGTPIPGPYGRGKKNRPVAPLRQRAERLTAFLTSTAGAAVEAFVPLENTDATETEE